MNELPGGKGYADVAFIPYKPDVPAIIIELKKDDTVDAAISQIKGSAGIPKLWRSID